MRTAQHDGDARTGDLARYGDRDTTTSGRRSPLAWIVLGFIWLYRATSPVRSPRCRFHPSCSSYALESVKVHGAIRGGWLAIRRLGRCHPWNPGGVDHVPPRK